ncbi:YegP family protein [Vibrio sp. Isolate24]|uniref:YegP family protein n=1 Tax=Vibrio sp. Isolate24 TaxID=2908534 RepID=UPI0023D94AC8|nr:YegP family protein [Vibrio sp. Isolate24]
MAAQLHGEPYYFVLKAGNGEVIATSEMYSSKQAAQNGVKSVQTNGSTTDIRDLT